MFRNRFGIGFTLQNSIIDMENFNENQPQPAQEPVQYQQPAAETGSPYGTTSTPGVPPVKPTLPNAVAVLVLGILSIVTSCWFVGLILGIVGLVLSGKGRRIHLASPESYTGYGMLNAGRVLSIIGVCIGGLYMLCLLMIGGLIGIGAGLAELSESFRAIGY